MKPDRPPEGAGLIDRNLLNQACLKHHISIGTVFDLLEMRPLWKETQTLCWILVAKTNCIICSCAHFCGPRCA